MAKEITPRLAQAKVLLAVADSADAKREAYKRAADLIVAHIEATGDTQAAVGRNLQVTRMTISKLVRWQATGCKADTPFLMDKDATKRAAKSHAKQVLADPEQRKDLVEALNDDERDALHDAVLAASASTNGALTADGKRRHEQRTMEEEAKARTRRAYDNLRARQHYYGEVPVSDSEREELGWSKQVIAWLLGETELDAELEEMLGRLRFTCAQA